MCVRVAFVVSYDTAAAAAGAAVLSLTHIMAQWWASVGSVDKLGGDADVCITHIWIFMAGKLQGTHYLCRRRVYTLFICSQSEGQAADDDVVWMSEDAVATGVYLCVLSLFLFRSFRQRTK